MTEPDEASLGQRPDDKLPGGFSVGDLVGDTYIVHGYLGRGAMGHVYHVEHQLLGAQYALKTLRSDKVTDLAWRRFQNEAQAIARLNHPNIVQIYNLGLHKGVLPFYVMDLLIGCDLAEKLQADGRLEPLVAAALFSEVCWGVSFAHKNGIVHRDIKPGNIFLLQNNSASAGSGARVKVVDFGIAKLSETKDPLNQMLTGIGDVVGTPFYMSPEQCMGERVDARSDIYSLGCALFESLTGVLPFRGRNPTDTMLLHQQAEIPTLLNASGGKYFGQAWEMLIATAMAKLPEDRYQTMESFGRDLQGILAAQSPGAVNINSLSAPALSNTEAVGLQPLAQIGPQSRSPAESQPSVSPAGDNFSTFDGFKTRATQGLAARVRSSLSDRVGTGSTPRLSSDSSLRKVLLPVGAGIAILAAAATYLCWPKPEATHVAPTNNVHATTGNAEPEVDAFEDEIVPFDGSLPQHQYPSTELLSKKPFCAVIADENNKKYRYFDFPKDVTIGIMTSEHQPKPFKAYGRFKIPQSDWLVFIPTDAAEHSPGCLKRFSANDINCVRLDRQFPQDALLEQVADIPDLQMLDLEHCTQVTADGAQNLAKFKKLKTLDCAYSSVDGAMLSRCHLWDSLEDLNLADLDNPRPFLNQLGRYKKLQRLTLKETKLSNADIAAIASIPHLYYLDLSDNKISREQLLILTTTPNLTELGLHGCGLGPADFDVLRRFTRLHHIYLKENGDKPGKWDNLQKLMPKVPIVGFGFISRIFG